MLGVHRADELRGIHELYRSVCREMKIKPSPLPDVGECPVCGKGFYRWNKRRVYDSGKCKSKAYRMRKNVTVKGGGLSG